MWSRPAHCWLTFTCSGPQPAGIADAGLVELREEARPCSPYRLPVSGGMDGVRRCGGGVLERLLHRDGEPVRVRVAQTASDAVLFGAAAHTRAAAHAGIERMRFALGVDDDLSELFAEHARDPLIGSSLRRRPWL